MSSWFSSSPNTSAGFPSKGLSLIPEKLVVQFESPFPLVAFSSPRATVSGAATLGSTVGPEGPGPEGREERSSGAVELPEGEMLLPDDEDCAGAGDAALAPAGSG